MRVPGFTRRTDGKVRCDAIVSTATGRATEPARRVLQVLGRTCPGCGSETADRIGTLRNRVAACADPFHGAGAR